MLAHLVVDLFIAQVVSHAQANALGRRHHLAGVGVGVFGDGRDHCLQRREPQRQMTGKVLDHDADEALHGAEHGAVEHHRRHLVGVLVDVEGAEAPGQVEVDLHGAALPVAADGVAQDVFELRPVEGAFAFVKRPRPAGGFERFFQSRLRLIPHGIVTDAL